MYTCVRQPNIVSGIQGYEKYLRRKQKDVDEIKKIRSMAEDIKKE